MSRSHKYRSPNFQQNHGIPGVVYVLDNAGLREGWYKIGCSRRSGAARANDLNTDATTGTPGTFKCIFECKTEDCGIAEQRVFEILHKERRGKRGQEYFEVTLEQAKEVIKQICSEVDAEIRLRPPKPEPTKAPISLPTAPSVGLIKKPEVVQSAVQPALFGFTKNKWLIAFGLIIFLIWYSQGNNKKSSQITPTISKSPAISKPLSPPIKQKKEESTGASIEKAPALQDKQIDTPIVNQEPTPKLESETISRPDLSRLSSGEMSSIEAACSTDKYRNGPVAYNNCLNRQLAKLKY